MVFAARRTLFGGPPPGLQVKVGFFVKTTGAATVAQPITNVGFQPRALILWTSGGTVDGTIRTQATGDARACIGIVSGTAAGEQFAASSTSDTAGGGGRRITQKAFLLTDAGGAVSSEASLASFDPDGFTLSWTTNAVGEAQVIHYLAIGGPAVQAKVIFVTSPAGTGNFATTGVGFQPNLIISTGSVAAVALDTATTAIGLRVGAATGPAARWASTMSSLQSVSQPAWRQHRNDKCVHQINNNGAVTAEMDHVSMDADGFTLNQTNALSTNVRMGILCLKVPNVAVGTFTKPTGGGPAVGSVTGLPFQLAGVLLASDQDISRANVASQTGSRFGLSAFTAIGAESSVHSVPDLANPVAFACLEKSAKAAVKIDNATPAVDAEATGTLDGNGFTLTWNANDAVATEYGYIALGS